MIVSKYGATFTIHCKDMKITGGLESYILSLLPAERVYMSLHTIASPSTAKKASTIFPSIIGET